jgi:hypothetical protein
MRTFLKNWNVVKNATNSNQLIVISDWNLTGKMVKLIRTENVYNNGVITESVVYYEVVVGTPNPSTLNVTIALPVPWFQLPFEHKTTIISYETTVTNITDNESSDTIRALAI